MGKSPAKWIKTILFPKKGSKSNLSKGRDALKPTSEKVGLVSAKEPISELEADPPLISQPKPCIGARDGEDSGLGEGAAPGFPGDGVILNSAMPGEDVQRSTNLDSVQDAEIYRLEQAVTKAQAAFRGYLARRAFRALKGIIRLQALIRGHLVRRQAVATLYSVHRIVKLQKLVHAQKDPAGLVSYRTCASAGVEKLFLNAYVRKLLASSPASIPLHLQYNPGETNSASDWLNRWTISRIWEAPSQSKIISDSKTQKNKESLQATEVGQVKRKHGVQKLPAANPENGSSMLSSESVKLKRHPKKVSKNPANSTQERSENGSGKVKSISKKTYNSTKEAYLRHEMDNKKPKGTQKKPSNLDVPVVSECIDDPAEKAKKDREAIVPQSSDMEMNPRPSEEDGPVDELQEQFAADLQLEQHNEDVSLANREVSPTNVTISNDQQKISRRRASLPVDQDCQEHGLQSTPRIPSYMAATKSAKAKFRGQNSVKSCEDGNENNDLARRYSLPASTSGKPTLSPRVQKLVLTAGKGVIRNDKSLSTSKDGNEKATQAEWRR